jgi:hypothetical protein
MGKFQTMNFEKPVVLKVAHDYNNKKIVTQLFKILRSSTRALALKIKKVDLEAYKPCTFLESASNLLPEKVRYHFVGQPKILTLL